MIDVRHEILQNHYLGNKILNDEVNSIGSPFKMRIIIDSNVFRDELMLYFFFIHVKRNRNMHL